MRFPAFLACFSLLACADVSGREFPELEQDAGELPALEQDAGALERDAARGPRDCLALPFAQCEGQWAYSRDPVSRYVQHPDTGRSTFACVTYDERCGQPWYTDSDGRCSNPHDLTALCTLVGGTCERAAADAAPRAPLCVKGGAQ